MDRKETAAQKSEFANEGEIDSDTATILGSPTGREENPQAEPNVAADDMLKPVGAEPRSAVTGVHDAGSGANETIDGLSSTEELTRLEAEEAAPSLADEDAEDAADADEDVDDEPVFDRAEETHL
jgi:hypothetical protein